MTRPEALELELSGSTLIAASAGAGKTHTITTLVLRLILEQDLAISEILVVTYTRAATAELRDRVRRRLRAASDLVAGDEVEDPELRTYFEGRQSEAQRQQDGRRLQRALQDFDEAAISTIHGFCQRVLAEYAFESGTPFELDFLEDQSALVEEVALDYRARQLYPAHRMLVEAASAGNAGPADLTALARGAAAFPRMEVLPREGPSEVDYGRLRTDWCAGRDRAVALWRQHRAQVVELLLSDPMSGTKYPAKSVPTKWADDFDVMGNLQPADAVPKHRQVTPQGLTDGTKKGQTAPQHPFFDAMGDWFDTHEALTKALQRDVLCLRVGAMEYARRELAARKERAGVQGFDDLLLRLDAALESETGEVLAARIRRAYRAALIDEFQDTDPVQYRIVRRIYPGDDNPVFMIGDPKQAIYGFRGADVFAYLRASESAARHHSLRYNWRSDPCLIDAVNHLFDRVSDPFVYPQIEFARVQAEPAAKRQLETGAVPRPPLEILLLPRGEALGDSLINKGTANRALPSLVAHEIAQLLASDWTVKGEPVQARHVAVLCRTNKQARKTQAALRERGVACVLEGDSSVFETAMAGEIERVMWAMAQPSDGSLLRAALATSVMGVSGQQLHAMYAGEDAAWDDHLAHFARWHQVWQEKGFVQAFHQMLDDEEVQERLLRRPDGERRLTDLLHLVELLHGAATRQRLGPLALLHWLLQMRVDKGARGGLVGESAQVRLESDAHAVRLTTIHKSKGLEYPIVFCPFLWDGALLRKGDARAVRFHDLADPQVPMRLDLGSSQLGQHTRWAEYEALAENLRLLYVALTRAKHRCVVVWGRVKAGEKSALGGLLHPGTGAATPQTKTKTKAKAKAKAKSEATAAPPWLTDGVLGRLASSREQIVEFEDDAALESDLQRLVDDSRGSIAMRWLDVNSELPAQALGSPPAETLELAPLRTDRRHCGHFRTTSFSGLTSRAGHGASLIEEGVDHDELDPGSPGEGAEPVAATAVALAEFPRGARPGNLIHHVFEHLDFQAGPEALQDQVAVSLERFGYAAPELVSSLSQGLSLCLQTQLPVLDGSLRLEQLACADRLDEMEFMFPVAPADSRGSDASRGALTPARLAQVFREHSAPGLCPDYAKRLAELGFTPVAGFLKGYIDLVFRHRGRYYVVDYKSNYLGAHPQDYAEQHLAGAMQAAHYHLQYHLYATAVHRHLRLRLPDYDYEQHFGGVLYLFVRGMAPQHPVGTGVYYDRPACALIDDLDALLGATGGS